MAHPKAHQTQRSLLGLATMALLLIGGSQARADFTTIDVPGSYSTKVTAISGNNIVGLYTESSLTSNTYYTFLYNISTETYTPLTSLGAFTIPALGYGSPLVPGISGNYIVEDNLLYNISTFTVTTLAPPGSVGTFVTGAAVSGNSVVGEYYAGFNSPFSGVAYPGFLYNISTGAYTALAPPQAQSEAEAIGVSGNNVVGWYYDANNATTHGFLYNTTTATYSALDVPGSTYTIPTGISGNNIIGNYINGQGEHSFVYNTLTSTYTTLPPGGVVAVSGNNVLGENFLYNASTSTYTTLPSPPGSTQGTYTAIDGNNLVGYYVGNGTPYNGFLYTPDISPVPAPSSLALLCIGIAVLTCYGWWQRIIRSGLKR